MRKIKYPFYNKDGKLDTQKKGKFEKSYLEIFNSDIKFHSAKNGEEKKSKDFKELNCAIKKINPNWDYNLFLIGSFEELCIIANCYNKDFENKQNKEEWNKLKDLFWSEAKIYRYNNYRSKITNFIRENSFKIETCYYCNIDFVNSFNHQFSSIDNFIKYGRKEDWETLINPKKGGGEIYKLLKEKKINDYNTLKNEIKDDISEQITLEKINSFRKNEHYSLDHVLPKNIYPFLSLSVFNLVPSCSSCNSKFKHEKEFSIIDELEKLSPTSSSYTFDKKIRFLLQINTDNENIIIDDLKPSLVNIEKKDGIDEFVDIFQLKGRYEFHSGIAEEMVKKRKKYPDTQIREIAKLLSVSENQVKKDLFGKELFEETNAPFEKYKKDIAEQLGLLD